MALRSDPHAYEQEDSEEGDVSEEDNEDLDEKHLEVDGEEEEAFSDAAIDVSYYSKNG